MADEYVSTPARALGLVLPPPGREKTALWAERVEAAKAGSPSASARYSKPAALDRCRHRGAPPPARPDGHEPALLSRRSAAVSAPVQRGGLSSSARWRSVTRALAAVDPLGP